MSVARLNFIVAAGLCLPAMLPSAASAQSSALSSEIRAQIDALRAEQARIAEMQRKTDAALQALEARLGQSNAAPTTQVAATPPASALVSSPESSRLAVTGDLRLRHQGDYSDDDARSRNSAQIRGRLGATFRVNDMLTIGSRIVTGDADDPNSTDVQLSNYDDDLQVSLDLAYAQLNLGDLKVFGGKLPQPFTRTDLVWDGDVNPQGIAGVYKHSLAGGSALRANALFFIIDEQAAGPESTMRGAQLGYDSAAFGSWKYDLSAAYYDYRLGSIAGGDTGDFRSNLRNANGSYRSDFNLGDLIVGATWTGAGERWPVRVVGDYVHNFEAATAADTGFGVDLSMGRASRQRDWRLTYGYSEAETDAVFATFSHDNIGIGTNYKLHALTFDYVPLPKTSISAIWYHYAPDHGIDAGSNTPGDWLDRWRLSYLVSF